MLAVSFLTVIISFPPFPGLSILPSKCLLGQEMLISLGAPNPRGLPTPMLDPVLREIVKNALLMVAQEAGIRAARSAGSTFVSQSAEVACALFDAQGRVIAQTEFGQMHISALRSMLVAVREDHPDETLRDGDVLVTNDPFRGGIHPTDVGAFRRIFYEGRPAFYCGGMRIVWELGG